MVSKSKIKANAKYDAEHCTGVYLKLNNKTDSDILNYLSSVPNRQGYIKQLIRDDMARTCSSVPKISSDSVPNSMSVPELKDPYSDILANAVHAWIDKATSVLSDEKPYVITDSVPENESEEC